MEKMSAKQRSLQLALGLIERQMYAEARTLLERFPDDPTAQKWLRHLDTFVTTPEDTIATAPPRRVQESEFNPLHSEIGGSSWQLGKVNQSIELIHDQVHQKNMMFLAGIVTLPLFGAGAALVAYAALSSARSRKSLKALQDKRRQLLDELENKYVQVGTMKPEVARSS